MTPTRRGTFSHFLLLATVITYLSNFFGAISFHKTVLHRIRTTPSPHDAPSVRGDVLGVGGACDGFDGVLHIARADANAATGTLFFAYVLNHIRYAEANNLLPWIHLSSDNKNCYDPDVHGREPNATFLMQKGADVSRIATLGMGGIYECPQNLKISFDRSYPGPPIINASNLEESNFTVAGNGIWSTYFQPLVPTFRMDDPSCRSRPLIEMPFDQIYPGMHKCAPWAVRSWPYNRLPQYLRPKANKNSSALKEWFAPMRRWGSHAVQEHYRLQPWLKKAVDEANGPATRNNQTCLAMHVRWTDKGNGRQKVSLNSYLAYAQAFVELGGQCIYLATDDSRVFDEMNRTWPPNIMAKIAMQTGAYRSNSSKPVFEMTSAHRGNTEALVDIYAMAKCSLLLHGFSAMTESVIYLNVDLHNRSVNLDDPSHISVQQFQKIVDQVLQT